MNYYITVVCNWTSTIWKFKKTIVIKLFRSGQYASGYEFILNRVSTFALQKHVLTNTF